MNQKIPLTDSQAKTYHPATVTHKHLQSKKPQLLKIHNKILRSALKYTLKNLSFP